MSDLSIQACSKSLKLMEESVIGSLLCFPFRPTGASCFFLLGCVCLESTSEVTSSSLNLYKKLTTFLFFSLGAFFFNFLSFAFELLSQFQTGGQFYHYSLILRMAVWLLLSHKNRTVIKLVLLLNISSSATCTFFQSKM